MFVTEPHVNEKFKNQQLLWHSYDSQELYEKNLVSQPELASFNLSYKFNSYGFRSEEFSNVDNVLSLGCSFTFGMGIAEDQTWSSIISKHRRLANFNLAIDGASADCCFRMALNWIPQLKPKVVLYQSPDSSRLEWFDEKHRVPHNMMAATHNQSLLYKEWIMNDNNLKFNHLKNLYAIQHIAESNGAVFVHIPLTKIKRLDNARDIGHFGPKTHKAIAEQVIQQLNWPKR